MKYIRQLLIILLLSFLGEIIHHFIPLPIPASIYGLILMLLGLISGIIPLDAVKDVSFFLIDIMPLMFIPAGAALLDSWGLLYPILLPFTVITLVTTVIVMGATGVVTQLMMKYDKKKIDQGKGVGSHERSGL